MTDHPSQQAAALEGVVSNNCNGDIACNCQDNTFLRLIESVIEHTCSAADGQRKDFVLSFGAGGGPPRRAMYPAVRCQERSFSTQRC